MRGLTNSLARYTKLIGILKRIWYTLNQAEEVELANTNRHRERSVAIQFFYGMDRHASLAMTKFKVRYLETDLVYYRNRIYFFITINATILKIKVKINNIKASAKAAKVLGLLNS